MTELAGSYRAARALAAEHGRTYYLASLLLPADRRPGVHALYGLARAADDIVDGAGTAGERAAALHALRDAFRAGRADAHPVLPAVLDTVARYRVPAEPFDDFFASMEADLTVSGYATWADLLGYMRGSAAAIGLMLLPVLGVEPGCERAAAGYAADLGNAFQLTNFIRDVGEDLGRGRVYLPADDLALFGLDAAALSPGTPADGRVRRLLAFEVARARELYRSAEPGIRLLAPESRECVRVAWRLYGGILDAVERGDYPVLQRRVSVPLGRRLAVALPAYARVRLARARGAPGAPGGRPPPRPTASR